MQPDQEYTLTDNAGFRVEVGDLVTVSFEGTVHSIESNGRVYLETAQGLFTLLDPQYQGLIKIHKTGGV